MTCRSLVLLAVLVATAFAEERIVFSRVFPGATPASFEVAIDTQGAVTYTEPDEEAIEFLVTKAEAEQRFEQAKALEYFTKDLATKRKNIASTGKKILRYEADGKIKGEAKFDYSDEVEARELTAWFVKVAETQQHLFELERVTQFDRLGINQALINLEYAFERDRVIAPGQLVPILTKINLKKNVVHMARARAAGLLERIEATKP